jgi:hypothetical protein
MTNKGTCSECPPENPVISQPNSILQLASLTWNIKQTKINDVSEYYLDFSENDIFFLEPINVGDLKSHLEVRKILTSLD